jgi:hypothetical protein
MFQTDGRYSQWWASLHDRYKLHVENHIHKRLKYGENKLVNWYINKNKLVTANL